MSGIATSIEGWTHIVCLTDLAYLLLRKLTRLKRQARPVEGWTHKVCFTARRCREEAI